MEGNQQEILENLISLYKEMYKAKNLFNKSYFRYTPSEVEKAINKAFSEGQDAIKKEKSKVNESILAIRTIEEVEKFYRSTFTYDYSNDKERKNCLKKIKLDDMKHLYYILYSSQPRKSATKRELLSLIEKYFESIGLALSLKP
ncbi:hypothetical protein [Clostridium sp. C8-1-8]|uniref:hypothetical protein n=1 Tax=Clostridium sp. C8-1-8 TaxID=2698831 RepID=UPI00136F208E|nr:hypothetical protein [Clostridium sp. C8-1-8]